MPKIRTFIAVETPSEMRKRAVQLIDRLSQTPAKVKWVDAPNLHWTFKFLDEVDGNLIPEICQALSGAAIDHKAFEIAAEGASAFPTPTRPRTVWLGVTDGAAEFVDLHKAVETALADFGFRPEHRRFQPHMTLGRVRRSPSGIRELGELITENGDFAAGRMTVDQLTVMASDLGRDGPKYQPLGHIPLAG